MSGHSEITGVPPREVSPPRLPKLCGADVELGNFIEGVQRAGGSGSEASRALLREIDGIRGATTRGDGQGEEAEAGRGEEASHRANRKP